MPYNVFPRAICAGSPGGRCCPGTNPPTRPRPPCAAGAAGGAAGGACAATRVDTAIVIANKVVTARPFVTRIVSPQTRIVLPSAMLTKGGQMNHRNAWWWAVAGAAVFGTALSAFQRPFRQFPGNEYEDFPVPPDFQEKTEWVFARLMYPPANYGRRGYGRFGGNWTQGRSSWTTDYPRSDRHF